MNVLITLKRNLIDKIMLRQKRFEMRKSLPKHMKIGEDGFFVVEKGSDEVKCWCRVDEVREFVMTEHLANEYSKILCVSHEYIINYAPPGTKVYLWGIGKIIQFEYLCRDSLFVDKNPQSFAYCPLSYGESY